MLITTFRINTSKTVTKQTTLTTFKINPYAKQGEGPPPPKRCYNARKNWKSNSDRPTLADNVKEDCMRRAMGIVVGVALALILGAAASAQEHEHAVAAKNKTATLMTGLGDWRHPVSTKNAQAQAFFDQGLRLIYAFNHDEAARSF